MRTLFFTFFKDSTIVISFCERALSALRELLLAFNLIIFVAIFFKERREARGVSSSHRRERREKQPERKVNFCTRAIPGMRAL